MTSINVEIGLARSLSSILAGHSGGVRSNYEKCRLDLDFGEWMYRTVLISIAACVAVAICALFVLIMTDALPVILSAVCAISLGFVAAACVYYGRAYAVKSQKDYRGAIIEANLVHAIGFMLTMAESNVPLKKMFENVSNLSEVYGDDIALESTYVLSLVEEDGMDVISAIRKAQASSPAAAWQELLIGIAEVHGSGGSLKEYLKGKYLAFIERKRMDVKKYNDSVQGLSSVFLSIVGIASIFVSIINLVFNMAGWLSNDSFVWLDALVIVPLGSFTVIRVLKAANPEV